MAPASVQQESAAEGVTASADDVAVLDPTVQLPPRAGVDGASSSSSSPFSSLPKTLGGAPATRRLVARVRAFSTKPLVCTAITLHAPSFEATGSGSSSGSRNNLKSLKIDALRRLLQHRVVAPGASLHFSGAAAARLYAGSDSVPGTHHAADAVTVVSVESSSAA